MFSVSFTGYRPEKLPFFGEDDPLCEELKIRLKERIEKCAADGAEVFYSGMARGVDTWCAEAVLELRASYPAIKLAAVIPFRGQAKSWSDGDKARYDKILGQCEKVICVSEEYTKHCMQDRNRALVDLCDLLIAVFDGQKGGTAFTVKYAQKKGKLLEIVSVL